MTPKKIGIIMLPVLVSNGKPKDNRKYRHWHVDREFQVYESDKGRVAIRATRLKSGKVHTMTVRIEDEDMKDVILTGEGLLNNIERND